jgi:glycosyltransferase involved in cell wall biosynthesis
MTLTKPLVSIGMPVYNGEKYLSRALDSLLKQDYQNFELIISDNASTDSTPQICRAYAEPDARITYYRTEQNMGAIWNFNRVFELARGKYFLWAAVDDWRAQNYLSECVACLERDPTSVLCYSKTYVVKPDLPPESVMDSLEVNHATPRERFQALVRSHSPWGTIVYSLMRASALRRTIPVQNYYGSDAGMVVQLSLMGSFVRCDETAFYYWAEVRDADVFALYKRVMESLHHANSNKGSLLPSWQVGKGYLRVAANSALPIHIKVYLMSDVIRYFFLSRTRLMEVFYLVASLTGLLRLRNHLLDLHTSQR